MADSIFQTALIVRFVSDAFTASDHSTFARPGKRASLLRRARVEDLQDLAPAFAGDATAPEKAATCVACHGADGNSTQAMFPHLAGQYANYLEQALREYRSGARKNPVMGAQAAALSDADIRELAAYYSKQKGPLHTPDVHSTAPKAAAR